MRNHLTRRLSVACCLALALGSAASAVRAQTPADGKPVGVVAVTSYDQLIQDVDYLAGLIGQPGASQQVDLQLNMFTQNKGLAGFDKTRPFGVVSHVIGTAPMFAVCLPVTDQAALLGVVQGFGVTSQDMGNGITQINAMGQDLYAKNANGWSLLSIVPDALATMPEDPSVVLGPLTAEHDVAVQVNVQNLPEAIRQQVLEVMANAARQGIRKGDNESDADFADRQQAMEADIAAQQQAVRELDQVLLGAAIDSRAQRAFIDVLYTAVAGTELAEKFAVNRETATNFAGFAQPGAAMTFIAAPKLEGLEPRQIEQLVANMRLQAGQAIDDEVELNNPESREKMKAAVGDFIDALQASLATGVLDIGAVLHMSPDSMTLVAGGAAADPAKVEAGLKKLSEIAAGEGLHMPEVKWNAENYNGIQFHVMEHSMADGTATARRLLGDTLQMAVGVGPNSVYFAAGRDWLGAVKKVVDDSAASPARVVAPMELIVSLAPIMATAAASAPEHERPIFAAISQMLSGEGEGADRVQLVAQPIDNGMRIHFEAAQGVLKAIGTAAMIGQRQAAMPAVAPAVPR